jgi:hypothetical protein
MSDWRLSYRFGSCLFLCGLAFAALGVLPQPASRADDEVEPAVRFPKTTAADRRASRNNLSHIGLALHQFHDTYTAFPGAAVLDKNGKPLLSWRVAILPYIEEGALYKEFRFDEPWDSKHNKKLLDKMPKLYAPTIQGKPAKPNTTYYQVLTGPDALFNPKWGGGIGMGTLGPRITQITDGTSKTAMVVEAGEAVPWTKPVDLVYDAKKPLPKLGGLFKEGTHVVLADGSVRFIARTAKVAALRALITPAGGEALDDKDLPEPAKK